MAELKSFVRTVIIADESQKKIRIIDIDMYGNNGVKYVQPSKRFVDRLNEMENLDRETARKLTAKEYHIPIESITFFK
jgi:hypothetical protein